MEEPKRITNLDVLAEGLKEWETCVSCHLEVSGLPDGQNCYDCLEKRKFDDSKAIWMDKYLKSMLGEKGFTDFTFDKFEKTQENEKALGFCKRFNPNTENLYLYGPCGSGKTHLAYATFRSYPTIIKSSYIYKQPDLLRLFRGKEAHEETREIQRLAKAEILLIDDIGVAKNTEFSLQILYEIIDSRIMNLKNGLIITSNLSIDDLASKLADSRLPDRLAGICKVHKIDSDQSYRVKNRNLK